MLIVTKVQWAVAVGAFYLPELLKILLVARNVCQDQSDSRSNRPKQPVKTGNYCRREPINVISKQTNAEDTESAAIKQPVKANNKSQVKHLYVYYYSDNPKGAKNH